MKKFTKLFLSCMAVSAITAAVATSAMAADGDLTVGYSQETGVVTASVEGASETAQSTVLVLAPDADLTDGISDSEIVYINQLAGANFSGGLLGVGENKDIRTEENAPGTYQVWVGYEDAAGFHVAKGSFTLGATAVLVGDADGNEKITNNDATEVLRYGSKLSSHITDDNFNQVAYSDGNYKITNNDATQILRYGSKLSHENVGETMAIPDAPAE